MILFCFVLVIASIGKHILLYRKGILGFIMQSIFFFVITLEAEKYAVGQEPCTWGPSFWCARRENAEKCGPGVGYL